MKADGGALVYIIIAVVSLVIRAISKNKNKEHPPVSSVPEVHNPESEQRKPQNTWQKELEDIFSAGTQDRKPEVIKVKQEPDEVSAQVRELNKYANFRRTAVTEGKGQHVESVFFHEDEEHEASDVNLEEFELRKAVIYAEVLNRKYF